MCPCSQQGPLIAALLRPTANPRQLDHCRPPSGICVCSTHTTNGIGIYLIINNNLKRVTMLQMHLIVLTVCASAQVPLCSVSPQLLDLCTVIDLFTVPLMRLSSVHVDTTQFTLADRPIRSLHSLPISLMMGAQHTDPRLNPCDVCTL